MNDYITAKQYLAALKNELLSGQIIISNQPEVNQPTSTIDDMSKSLNSQLCDQNKQLREQIQNLQNELELLRRANEESVIEYNKKIECQNIELENERLKVSMCRRDNRMFVSLDSILEWASEQHKDSKEVTLIQNMIYDRFELTKKEKELVRKLDVVGLRQLIIQHADQVVGIAEKDSNIVHK